MGRGLSSSFQTELDSRRIQVAYLVELEFDSGTNRLWTGYGQITYDSDTYSGGGDLLGVKPPSETTDIRAEGASVTLSGIPASYVSTALSEPYQGRPARMHFAVLNGSGSVIGATTVFEGRMDQMQVRKAGDTCEIRISLESNLIDLNRSRERRYTHEDQQSDYSGDKGFEYVVSLQNKRVTWGPDNRDADQRVRDLARNREDVTLEVRERRYSTRAGKITETTEVAVGPNGEVLASGDPSFENESQGPARGPNQTSDPFSQAGGGGR